MPTTVAKQETEEILINLFARQEISHISIWLDGDVWYVLKKKPFTEERLFSDTSLTKALLKLL